MASDQEDGPFSPELIIEDPPEVHREHRPSKKRQRRQSASTSSSISGGDSFRNPFHREPPSPVTDAREVIRARALQSPYGDRYCMLCYLSDFCILRFNL